MNKKKEKMAEGSRQIPIIKGEVTRHLCKDFDGLFPLSKRLANKTPIIPKSYISHMKPGLQVFYELVLPGHDDFNQTTFDQIILQQANNNDENNDDNDNHQIHLTSPRINGSFIDAITPNDLRLRCGFFQVIFCPLSKSVRRSVFQFLNFFRIYAHVSPSAIAPRKRSQQSYHISGFFFRSDKAAL